MQHETPNNKTEMRPMILAAWLGLCQWMHHQYSDNRKARDSTRGREKEYLFHKKIPHSQARGTKNPRMRTAIATYTWTWLSCWGGCTT